MTTYRTFLNSDPPQIVALWNRQPELPSRIRKISNTLLENQVFAKLYFDPDGLIVALDGDTIVGFVHCGFGPNELHDGLEYSNGIISQLVLGEGQSTEVAVDLIQRAMRYFSRHETRRVYVGSHFPASPFYQGLYGGTWVPGLLAQESMKVEAFEQTGFEQESVIEIWQLNLAELKSAVDRPLMAARRNFEIRCVSYAEPESWWDHCRFGDQRHLQFQLVDRKLQIECGNIQYWTTRPIDSGWEQSLLGLGKFELVEGYKNEEGVTACFVLDSLKRLAKDGFVRVEAQLDENEEAIRPLLTKYGFAVQSRALQMSRAVTADQVTAEVTAR